MSTLTNSLKQRLRDGDDPLYGLWLSLGSESAAEALAHAGYDWLCIDMEHAPNDSRDVASQLRAIAAAHLPSEPVVRVPAREPWLVKRALDAGARTLMLPRHRDARRSRARGAAHALSVARFARRAARRRGHRCARRHSACAAITCRRRTRRSR